MKNLLHSFFRKNRGLVFRCGSVWCGNHMWFWVGVRAWWCRPHDLLVVLKIVLLCWWCFLIRFKLGEYNVIFVNRFSHPTIVFALVETNQIKRRTTANYGELLWNACKRFILCTEYNKGKCTRGSATKNKWCADVRFSKTNSPLTRRTCFRLEGTPLLWFFFFFFLVVDLAVVAKD